MTTTKLYRLSEIDEAIESGTLINNITGSKQTQNFRGPTVISEKIDEFLTRELFVYDRSTNRFINRLESTYPMSTITIEISDLSIYYIIHDHKGTDLGSYVIGIENHTYTDDKDFFDKYDKAIHNIRQRLNTYVGIK